MTLIGLDFDNTLVNYDGLFHKLAVEKRLIEKSTPMKKTIIRDYLRSIDKEDEFTILQGEVYGKRILEANGSPGMIEALKHISNSGIKMVLVSHKTQFPYKGPKYDLRKAALKWLEAKDFFNEAGLNWRRDEVHFEASKEDKINKIVKLGCTHYIDDLPEILRMLPNSIKRIHYDPSNLINTPEFSQFNHWSELMQWKLK